MSKAITHSSSVKIRRITATGLFAALIYVFTAYLHIPTGAGYTHAGDGLIYLAACILPTSPCGPKSYSVPHISIYDCIQKNQVPMYTQIY